MTRIQKRRLLARDIERLENTSVIGVIQQGAGDLVDVSCGCTFGSCACSNSCTACSDQSCDCTGTCMCSNSCGCTGTCGISVAGTIVAAQLE